MDPSGIGFREASFLASWLWRAGILLEVGAAPPRPSSYPSFNLADIRAAVSTMSDHPQQPSNTSSAGQSDNAAPADARAQAGPAPPAARPLRGMASMRGAASLRGGLGRGASVSSSASMVPSRSSYASPAPGAAGSAGPGSGVRMQFRPVMPQRRKASASPAPTSSTAPESSTASPLATPGSTAGSTRGGGRGRGRGGARPPRQPTQMTASGPFALGPSARPTGKKVAPIWPGGSSLTPAPGSDSQRSSTTPKPDPDRASYRNPDKLKDAEQYSDPEDGGVEIVDMDEVHILDELAPRALPRVAEKASKKDKQKAADARQKKMDNRLAKDEREAGAFRVKSEDDETMPDLQPGASSSLQTSGTLTAISSASVSPQPEEEEEERGKTADALDLSESEGEELMDDLVDDFVFHDDDDASPENRLYLFQFPQLFPKFKAPKKSEIAAADAAPAPEAGEGKESLSSKRRSVSFAEGTTGGAGKARPTSVKDEVAPSSEIDDDPEAAASEEDDKKRDTKRSGRSSSKEGLVGKLNVYRDGRVFLHFGELVMEVTGGSQSTFLQQVMLLDPSNRTATALGELHRKFIVSPELDCMLNDIKLYDQEQLVEQQRIKKEQEDKEEADRLKYGASAASFNAIGR